MIFSNKKEAIILFFGDIVSLYLSLWMMLLIRHFEIPSVTLFKIHAIPFSILFAVWVTIFFIAGLYEKHTLVLKSKISSTILNAQIINSIIAVTFFYLTPYFGIAPKTNLFIYLAISFTVIIFWRLYIYSSLESRKKENAILIGTGEEMSELEEEVNNNSRYDLYFISSVDLEKIGALDFQEEIIKRIYSEDVHVIAADLKNEKVEPFLPRLYNLIFSKIRFIDMHKVYEDIFDRIPLSLVKYSWFLENISNSRKDSYDILKRIMDIILSFSLGVLSLVFYPFVWLLIKLEDGGPIFFIQERVGKSNKIIKLVKFRSMSAHNEKDGIAKNPTPTKTGRFLRKTRIDELPQLWNVLKGDLSMIGPRPEIPALVKVYEKEIPYYNIRHLIKPGLSGWAQIYQKTPPKFSVGHSKTKIKLSYDLFYIKNRSIIIDFKIALKTIKALLSRGGV